MQMEYRRAGAANKCRGWRESETAKQEDKKANGEEKERANGVVGGTLPFQVLNHAVEFTGAVEDLSVDDRLAIANMTTEWGALAGVFPADNTLLDWITSRHKAAETHKRPSYATRLSPGAVAALEVRDFLVLQACAHRGVTINGIKKPFRGIPLTMQCRRREGTGACLQVSRPSTRTAIDVSALAHPLVCVKMVLAVPITRHSMAPSALQPSLALFGPRPCLPQAHHSRAAHRPRLEGGGCPPPSL